jgi:hypothetical protein
MEGDIMALPARAVAGAALAGGIVPARTQRIIGTAAVRIAADVRPWLSLPPTPVAQPAHLTGRERILWMVARDLYPVHRPRFTDGHVGCPVCPGRAIPCKPFAQAADLLGVLLPASFAPQPSQGGGTG